MAGQFIVPLSLDFNNSSVKLNFTGSVSLSINTSGQAINETIAADINGDGTVDANDKVVLPKGPYVQIGGTLDLKVFLASNGAFSGTPDADIGGTFVFEQITSGTAKVVLMAIANAHVSALGVTADQGEGAFVLGAHGGVAGSLQVDVTAGSPGPGLVSGSGTVQLKINTTGGQVHQTIAIAGGTKRTDFDANQGYYVQFSIVNATLEIPRSCRSRATSPLAASTFPVTGGTRPANIYGATNVEIFLGFIAGRRNLRRRQRGYFQRCPRRAGAARAPWCHPLRQRLAAG